MVSCNIKIFELEYKKRGFNEEELEIFIAHQGADIEHSDAQYEILEKNIANIDLDEVDNMVKRTFATSRGYERMKLKFANLDKPLSSFIKQN